MTKTFTCRELGGICNEKISGETFMEIIQKGMAHMQADQAHMDHMSNPANADQAKETKEQWFERMQKEFDARAEDMSENKSAETN